MCFYIYLYFFNMHLFSVWIKRSCIKRYPDYEFCSGVNTWILKLKGASFQCRMQYCEGKIYLPLIYLCVRSNKLNGNPILGPKTLTNLRCYDVINILTLLKMMLKVYKHGVVYGYYSPNSFPSSTIIPPYTTNYPPVTIRVFNHHF